ncbi:hypothetical protein [Paenibacillus tarimensis]|nr:hypothetical protein [Paenibacillus tarimensis]
MILYQTIPLWMLMVAVAVLAGIIALNSWVTKRKASKRDIHK